jgi:hypothetical protein
MTASQLWLRYAPVGLKDERADVMQMPIKHQAVKVTASGNKAFVVGRISDAQSDLASDNIVIRLSGVWSVLWINDEGATCAVAQSLPPNWNGISSSILERNTLRGSQARSQRPSRLRCLDHRVQTVLGLSKSSVLQVRQSFCRSFPGGLLGCIHRKVPSR